MSLYKQNSWSPDIDREELWRRRKSNSRRRGVNSVTDDDLDELKACIELGFGFRTDSPDIEPKLSNTLPALDFYCAVNKHYSNCLLSRSSSLSSVVSDAAESVCSSTNSLIDPSDEPEMVKTKLKQWARVVACSVQQFSGEPN